MPFSGDPVGDGLVTSLAHPGGNLTGLSNLSRELNGKRLELLKEAVPGLSRVAVLWNATNPVMPSRFKETGAAARALGLLPQSLRIHGPGDLAGAFHAATRGRAGALLVVMDPLTALYRNRIAELAAKSHLPAMHGTREYVGAGGLMAYGTNFPDMFRRAATYVDKILRGAKPGDLPVEQPTKFELVINIKTAKALRLTIPQSVLIRADEVIQ
jgi:putative ABC transport system substrate-binding protein